MGLSQQDPKDFFVSPSRDPLLRACCTLFFRHQAKLSIIRTLVPQGPGTTAETIPYSLDAVNSRQFPPTGPHEGWL